MLEFLNSLTYFILFFLLLFLFVFYAILEDKKYLRNLREPDDMNF